MNSQSRQTRDSRFIQLLVYSFQGTFATVLALITGCSDQPTPVLKASSEFELEIIGARHYPDAIFGLGYAFAHGFSRVDLYGETYLQATPGIVFKSKQIQPLPAYKVVLDQRKTDWLSVNTLKVLDQKSGIELATFALPSQGWPGDQAGAWLAKLLLRDATGKRPQQFDISDSSQVVLLDPSSRLQSADLQTRKLRLSGCPPSVTFHTGKSDHGSSEIRTPEWTLLSPYGFREVFCSRERVFVLSAHRQEDVEVIAIDDKGIVVARGFVRNKVLNLGNQYHHTKIVLVSDSEDRLILRQAFFVARSPLIESELAKYEVSFSIPWSALLLSR
jgi:hypothetical protein